MLATGPGLLHRLRVRCFACDAEHQLASGDRIGFRETCGGCGTDLHACRNCGHHDPGAYNECREPGTERISDRERANRCEWFAPAVPLADGGTAARQRAESELDALFKKG